MWTIWVFTFSFFYIKNLGNFFSLFFNLRKCLFFKEGVDKHEQRFALQRYQLQEKTRILFQFFLQSPSPEKPNSTTTVKVRKNIFKRCFLNILICSSYSFFSSMKQSAFYRALFRVWDSLKALVSIITLQVRGTKEKER